MQSGEFDQYAADSTAGGGNKGTAQTLACQRVSDGLVHSATCGAYDFCLVVNAARPKGLSQSRERIRLVQVA